MLSIIFNLLGGDIFLSPSYGASAVFSNPSGLALYKNFSFYYAFNLADSSSKLSFSFNNMGFFFSQAINDKNFSAGISSAIKIKNLYFGISSFYGAFRKDIYGLTVIPYRFLSISSVFIPQEANIKGIIGLKPFTDRIVLEGSYDNNNYYDIVLKLIPLNGIFLYGKYAKEKISIGLGIGLSNSSISYFTDIDAPQAGLLSYHYDKPAFPSLIKPFKKSLAIKLTAHPETRSKPLFFGQRRKNSFYDFILALLTNSKNISSIYIDLTNNNLPYYQAEEVRNTLLFLKQQYKTKIVFYAESYDLKSLYIASVGDSIVINPSGLIFTTGLYSEVIYLKTFLDSLGIGVNLVRAGKYKSAGEPFIKDTISMENKEQLLTLLTDIKGHIVKTISNSRHIPADSLIKIIDSFPLIRVKKAVKLRLVDKAGARPNNKKILSFNKIDKEELSYAWDKNYTQIAVVILDGGIINGRSSDKILFTPRQTGDRSFIKLINKLKNNKNIKAVVLRINSPGGSALASENIWRALKRLKKEKPLVVSMGGMAASGGYYIASIADFIFTDNTTITGSIGVFSIKFSTHKLLRNLGITPYTIKTSPHGDMFSKFRDFTEEEKTMYERTVISPVYWTFITRVNQGRGLSTDSIKKIAGGRIWSGMKACKIGLADSIGGLKEAIEKAKIMAGINKNIAIGYYLDLSRFNIFIDEPYYLKLLNENELYLMPFYLKIY